ncbi:MAG: patatin-like phospholipase family protein [Rhodospirillum sp.]|nr:patatin-like phospholipase family protein [Rhodospirillum sp.]MCF8489758.1 patatin-like phospholipase family protein [Rhodospirillum sp.]MCF8501277.1 patatin-like phospholipase family protein [Rhodospirillum sp.]
MVPHPSASPERKTLTLALQGGGAHGAYTWGVLDRLLEEPRLDIDAVSGTSAGAMNAVCLAEGLGRHGHTPQGKEAAREALERFWLAMADAAVFSPLKRTPLAAWLGDWSLEDSPGYWMGELLGRTMSPYQWNPLDINPLREVVEACIDFDAVRHCSGVGIFITATNVRTGRPRVFKADEVGLDQVMASACLPHLFKAVEIDGVPYWDGGYMGNPSLWPLIYMARARDILLVQINPLIREETPRTSQEILNRMNEITFNASLLKELRAINFVTRLLDDGALDETRYKRMFIHAIEAEDELKPLGASSKMNADRDFFLHLRDIGRRAANDWLAANFHRVGLESTVDVRDTYL